MNQFSRRAFVSAGVAGAAMLCAPRLAGAAAAQCSAKGLRPFLPERLTVDCASRQNFKTFRTSSDFLGLAGVVSMTFVSGRFGSYPAGNLFLFPWLKPAGQALAKKQGKQWPTVVPANTTHYTSGAPIPDSTLPVDEYFCRYVLRAPGTSFIGFGVDVPFSKAQGRLDWFANADLADGAAVGIDWNSPNLNGPWFDGEGWIPDDQTCNGATWRRLIVDALHQASAGVCYAGPLH
jgi:hypothetical protein